MTTRARRTRIGRRSLPYVWGIALLLVFGVVPAFSIDVFVRSPRDTGAVFGAVEVELEILSAEPIAEVEVKVDGEVVGILVEEPWRLVVDVGQENRSHLFEITAKDVVGQTASREVLTPAIMVDDELDLELQQLFVTVTRGGERVNGLGRFDFTVSDDGETQEIVTFEGADTVRGDVPLTVVILVDSSLSMRGEELRSALAGAHAFFTDMRELDLAKVIVFSDRPLATTRFTGDPAEVAAAVEGVEAAGGSAINDHLYLALKELDTIPGQRAVILLSDGEDVESVLGMDDVRFKAGRSQSLIYWIRHGAAGLKNVSRSSAWRDALAHRHEIDVLEQVVGKSGGRILDIARIDDAPRAFREVLAELRGQYVVGYYPSSNRNDGAWHEVKVRVEGPYQVRARAGYFDDQL